MLDFGGIIPRPDARFSAAMLMHEETPPAASENMPQAASNFNRRSIELPTLKNSNRSANEEMWR